MIGIIYDAEHYAVELCGHAGFDEAGKDIVCAAISALSYALEMHLTVREDIYRPEIFRKEEEARCVIKARPRFGKELRCHEVFETVMDGMRLIREYYPEHITIEERGN